MGHQTAGIIQGLFQGSGPRLAAASPEPHRLSAAQPSGGSHATQLDTSKLNLGGSRGQQLPEGVQKKMESFFNTDFSDVRVHVGQQASSIGALAFTLGSNLYFAPGQYNPNTRHGQQLLGHELTHVMQQRAGRVRNPYGSGVAVVQDHAMEAEADRMGMMAAAQPMMAVQAKRWDKAPSRQGQAQAMVSGSGGTAPHVQAALSAVGQSKAAVAKGLTAQRQSGHTITIGTYMHQGAGAAGLPSEVAGHSFVSIQGDRLQRQSWGFSPANFSTHDLKHKTSQLRLGVPGRVHRDDSAFSKPGVRTQTYSVSPEQAQAAMAKVNEYKSGTHRFSLLNRQCSTFATDVLKAAHVEGVGGVGVKPPAEMYSRVGHGPAGLQTKPGPGAAQARRPAAHVAAALHRK